MMLSLINRLQGRDVPIWLVEVSEMPLIELREPEGTIGGATAIAVMMDDKIPWYWRLFRHPLTWWYLRKRKKLARQETRAGGTVRYGLVGEMEYRAAPYFWKSGGGSPMRNAGAPPNSGRSLCVRTRCSARS